jgi:hypothetical protein
LLPIFTSCDIRVEPTDEKSLRNAIIVRKLTEDELHALKNGEPVVSKLLLHPRDYRLFHYREGDRMQAASQNGNRIGTTIKNIEVVSSDERFIVILTLMILPDKQNKNGG